MLFSASALLAAAAFVGEVAAHGYVPFIRINGTTLPGWDVTKGQAFNSSHPGRGIKVRVDGYANPQPLRIVRATKADSGFVSSPGSGEITCSIGNSKLPSVRSAPPCR